jgi:hypothetical protein
MSKLIAERAGLRVYECDYENGVDIAGLTQLSSIAWRHDYGPAVRIRYDEAYFRWLLRGNDWVALIVLDENSKPVGSILSLMRILRLGEACVPAAYSTQWVVAPNHRRTGVAAWLGHLNTQLLFERRGRAAQVGMFHVGHAALSTLGMLRLPSELDGAFFDQGAIWSMRLRGSRSASLAARGRRPEVRPSCTGFWNAVRFLGIDEAAVLGEMLIRNARPACTEAESFGRIYLDSEATRSGTLLCVGRDGTECALSFSLHDVAIADERLGTVGQIQCVQSFGCSAGAISCALQEMLAEFSYRHCIAACIVDQGVISTEILRQVGFAPTDDRLAMSVWATGQIVQKLRSGHATPCLDFL